MGDLEGKVAIVTGAARGLGLHLARRLVDEGCRLAVCDLDAEGIRSAAQDIARGKGMTVLPVQTDITDPAQVAALVTATVAEYSRVDLLVANAGLSYSGGILEIEPAAWRKIIDVNLFGYFLCAREASREMIRGGGGAIVQINSRTGKRGSAKNSAYAASKGGGIVLTQSLSAELAEHHIRVNCVCPGPMFESDLWQTVLFKDYAARFGMTEAQVRARYTEEIPLRRGCTYDDVANVVIFLLSEKAGYMTGQAVNVTGGATVW